MNNIRLPLEEMPYLLFGSSFMDLRFANKLAEEKGLFLEFYSQTAQRKQYNSDERYFIGRDFRRGDLSDVFLRGRDFRIELLQTVRYDDERHNFDIDKSWVEIEFNELDVRDNPVFDISQIFRVWNYSILPLNNDEHFVRDFFSPQSFNCFVQRYFLYNDDEDLMSPMIRAETERD